MQRGEYERWDADSRPLRRGMHASQTDPPCHGAPAKKSETEPGRSREVRA